MKQTLLILIFCVLSLTLAAQKPADCCKHLMRQSRLDSIKKFKAFGEIIESEPRRINRNLIPFKQNNKWGFLNYKKEIAIPALYDSAGFFWKDDNFGTIATVKKDGVLFYIDQRGDRITGPEKQRKEFFRLLTMIDKSIYKNLRDLDRANFFIEVEGEYGFRRENDTTIRAIYNNYGFVDGELLTLRNAEGWILLDSTGKILTEPFDTITHFANRKFAIVKKKQNMESLIGTDLLFVSRNFKSFVIFPRALSAFYLRKEDGGALWIPEGK